MKLSPSTIAANLSAAAAAEAEAAANSNSTTSAPNTAVNNITSSSVQSSNHTSIGSMNINSSGSKLAPKDTQVVAAILKEMGIAEYEPRVLPQLVEFAYRYVSRVLEDAQLFSSYAKKKVIDTDDVSIAVQMQVDRSFVGPPSRDVLLEIARNKNTQPLPPIKSHNGLRLPADRYSLVSSNVRLVSSNKQLNQSGQSKSLSVRTGTSLLSGNSFMNSKLSISAVNSNATNKINNSGSQHSSNSFLNNSTDVGTKRKLEDS